MDSNGLTFTQGMVCAAAIMMRAHGDHPAVTEILGAAGINSKEDFEKENIDDYDREAFIEGQYRFPGGEVYVG